MFRFGKEMILKNPFLQNIKHISKWDPDPDSDPVFFGSPGSGSEKNGPDPQHWKIQKHINNRFFIVNKSHIFICRCCTQ